MSAQKGWVTRAVNNANKVLAEVRAPLSSLQHEKDTLTSRWLKYENMWQKYEEIKLQSDEDIKTETDSYCETEDLYNKVSLRLDVAIAAAQALQNASASGIPPVPEPNLNTRCKMPDIKIPEFHGDPKTWNNFWDTFNALVHSKSDIPPVVKFTYLKDALHGIAKESIGGFQLKEADYMDAIQTLKDNFADPRKIKRKLVRHWIKLKEPNYNAKELLEFRIGVQTTLRSLGNYHDLDHFDFMVEEQIHIKLPIEASEYICRHFSTQYPSLSQLLEGLQILIEHLQIQSPKVQRETPTSCQLSHNRTHNKYVENKPKNLVGSYSVTQRDRKCLFCHKTDHTSHECQTYNTVSKRRDKLFDMNRCTRCIGVGHSYKECQTKFSPCRTCGKTNHHGLFCFQANKSANPTQAVVNAMSTTSKPKSEPNKSQTTNSSKNEKQVSTANATTTLQVVSSNQLSATALPTATAVLVNQVTQQKLESRVFFDQGSQRSFIATSLAKQLQLPTVEEINLNIRTFQHDPVESRNAVVQPLLNIGRHSQLATLVVMDNLDTIIHTPGLVNTADLLSSKGVTLADKHLDSDVVCHIGIIIGADYYPYYIKGFDRLHGINLLNTSGGKVIYGPILPCLQNEQSNQDVAMNVTVMRISNNHDVLNISPLIEERTEEMHKLWDLETIGISPQETAPEDEYAYELFLDSVQFHSGQYWVRLPWKPNPPPLPLNFRMALGQLNSLLSTLRHKENNLEHYHKVITEQMRLKFIERVPEAELNKQNCHYLPHHAVEKTSDTTPIRVVFNCSARAGKGTSSLNDCLLTGPSLTTKLVDVLTNFRINKYAYSADISKAFLRVGLQCCDRDFTRFLWIEDIHQIPPKIVTFRFTSVLFGSTSSPFLLQATLTKHIQSSHSPLKEILLKSFYVDNFQGTTNDETTLLQTFYEANKTLAQANMPLQTWNSNSPQLQTVIQETYPDYNRPTQVNILGMSWNTDIDTLSVKKLTFPCYPNLTKRQLLSLVSRTFDPLGLVSPLTIRGKLLVQKAWLEKTGWDAPLNDSYRDEWEILLSDLESVHTISFPRSVCNTTQDSQLHVFCDASSKAYGAVAYIVNGSETYLLTSRARVNPVPSRSIPQLELTALQVGAQLTTYIIKTMSLQFEHVILWSDNEAVLQWVRNQGSDITYVKNRVNEIRRLSNHFRLYYVPTKMNPADLLSRGMNLNQFKKSSLWFHGPEWLSTNEWPLQKACILVNEIVEDYTLPPPPIPIFDYESYSSLSRILNITKYVLQYLKLCIPRLNPISALQYWLRFIQKKHYGSIVSLLMSGVNSPGPSDSKSMINDLGLYLDDKGIIHCRGRIQNASLPFTSRYPILLPSKSHLTTLLIEVSHKTSLHEGISGTLAEVRSVYWIPKGRQAVKKVISRCNLCQRIMGQPYRYPEPPPLPVERVKLRTPFHTTGVDYTGAIQLSKSSSILPEKYYICLFTCTSTRAIHLELAKDLSAETFLLLFRRFCARRSLPSKLISDNGTNFKATYKFLQALAQEPLVSQFFENKQIQWHFIAPRAPWQGGFYERLISIVKDCIHKVLYHRKITFDELSTVLTEVETRVNNRPLTYLTEDLNSSEAITPSHLLHARRIQSMPCFIDDQVDPTYMDGHELRTQYIKVSKIIQHFEKIWKKEYLFSLRERHYGAKTPVDYNCIKVGDLVLLQSDQQRNDWPLGRIVKVYPNPENTIRMVDVLSKGKISLRTIEKLIPLEVDLVDVASKETLMVDSGDLSSDSTLNEDSAPISRTQPQTDHNTRPRRRAANQAELLRKQLIASDQL